MGTDIHLYIEKQDTPGVWVPAVCPAWPCPYCAGNGIYPNGETCVWCKGAKATSEPYCQRNYNLFAMLADVRNGNGSFEPLAEPRGLPEDTSIANTENIEYGKPGYVWLGDHSHSYCTLAEALAYDYSRTTKHRGRPLEEKAPTEGVYAVVEWESTYRASAGTAWFAFLEACRKIDADSTKIRFVFGFDS